MNTSATIAQLVTRCFNAGAMTSQVTSAANYGYDGRLIQIECDSSNGLPGLIIVGLGNKAIDEAKERIRSAVKNSGLDFPRKRITLNLAPADLPKDGSSYDLPMALAILATTNQISSESLEDTLFVGELALDNSIRPVRGIIGYAETAKRLGISQVVVPAANAAQASLIEGVTVLGASTLRELYLHLSGEEPLQPTPYHAPQTEQITASPSLNDVYGQEQAKRALIIAAAGRHNLLLHGPPGSGKTMLAKALLSILPPPSPEETIAITKIHSLAGELREQVLTERPFRTPHHTSSSAALIGGGPHPKPGEISLAHFGVLFLDELPEYPRSVLESLRQPLEDRTVSIARANDRVTYPADFMLIATQNPCPCGFLGDDSRECMCGPQQIASYQKRISGPLLDRLDMIVQMSRVEQQKLLVQNPSEISLDEVQQQIKTARRHQLERLHSLTRTNAQLSNREIQRSAGLQPSAKSLLDQASQKLHLSARGYIKVVRVARTIADLEDSRELTAAHIAEALQYRQREKL